MLIERHGFVNTEGSSVVVNGEGILLNDVSGEIGNGEAEGFPLDFDDQGAGTESDGSAADDRDDGDGAMAIFGGDGPGCVFGHLAVGRDANAEEIVAQGGDLLAGVAGLDLDAAGKRGESGYMVENKRGISGVILGVEEGCGLSGEKEKARKRHPGKATQRHVDSLNHFFLTP